jgi:dihydropyrimidine dehydrogenase (NAD+) subunit PreA
MSERGMGSAVGQVPDYACMITEWVKEVATVPVMVKLTPNVSDVTAIGRAAVRGGADALSLINTVNSIMGIDLETLAPKPAVRGQGSHGGYCGPAVKPIALNMVAAVAADHDIRVPISGIGGIQAWQDAVEFLLLGASSVQVCTAVMHYGFRIVEQLRSGLENWMTEKGYRSVREFSGLSVPRIKSWGDLDLNYKIVAEIAGTMISGGHRVVPGSGGDVVNVFTIDENTCVGCNMCSLVCPVDRCITMREIDTGLAPMSWNQYQLKLARGEVEPIEPPQHA